MIRIPQPAMAINANDVPGPNYKMWNTRFVTRKDDPRWIMINVASVAKAAGGKLKALVINCHGSAGRLGLGTGIARGNTDVFEEIKGLVDDIYITACQVAFISGPRTSTDGNLFSGEIAKAAAANVYVSTASQDTGLWPSIPYGYIDGFEGRVYKYKSDGSNELTSL
ncbi:MAG: hypothetical protein U0167_09505 [bacterium]